ncbi:MAG: diguanylate cyclase [Gammaproteobacteria bacterium]|jgi:diguanylate cyclase (GGDEF)-like protein|nr:diguanylate cyclase [Gammaproteobacteria bacterium]
MPTSLETLRAADTAHAVEIAERVWWVGHVIPDDNFQCHVYLIEQGDQSVLLDPGSQLTFKHTLRKIEEVVPFGAIRWFVCHHQDPDIAASMPLIDALISRPDAALVTHWRAHALLKHYGLALPFWLIEEHDWRLPLEDRTLEFIFTPYAHFPGAFCSFDWHTRVLFSSDLFGGFTATPQLVAVDETYLNAARPFHEHYIPSTDILDYALTQLERFPIAAIAPQHGSIIPAHLIDFMIDKLRHLQCGIYLLGQHDTDIQRLSELNRTLREITETMLLYRDFRDIATRLLAVIQRSLPVAHIDYYAQLPSEEFLALKAKARFVGIIEPRVPEACHFFGHTLGEWERAHQDDPALRDHWLHKQGFCVQSGAGGAAVIAIPLAVQDSEVVDAMALMTFDEQPVIDENAAQMIAQMIEPLKVALEREVIYRSIDLERERAYQRSIRDPLTKLFTRFYMQDVLQRHLALQERNMAPPVAALMIDLDYFKQINDRYGHGAGDRVLEQVAESISKTCRSADVPVRFGGEEFLVLVIGQGLDGAVALAQRLHALIEQQPIDIGEAEPLRVTASLGLAERHPDEAIDALIHRADTALYEAKRAGRNCYRIAGQGIA